MVNGMIYHIYYSLCQHFLQEWPACLHFLVFVVNLALNLTFLKGSNSVNNYFITLLFGIKVLDSCIILIVSSCCLQFSIFSILMTFLGKKHFFNKFLFFKGQLPPRPPFFFRGAGQFLKAKISYLKVK